MHDPLDDDHGIFDNMTVNDQIAILKNNSKI